MNSPHLFKRFTILIVLSLCLLLFDFFHLLSFPKKLVLTITTPVEYGIYSLYQQTASTFSFLTFWHNGYKELTFLKERNAALSVDAAQTEKLKEENEILKKQFAKQDIDTKILLPSRVLGFGRYLIIDKGNKDGVKKGQVVLLENIYIGIINEVADNISRIRVATDPDGKIAAITTQTRAKGIVAGSFGAGLVLSEVLQAETLKIDDTIESFSPDILPSGLLIGKIVKVEKVDSAIFQKAIGRPIVEYGKLKMVFVKVK